MQTPALSSLKRGQQFSNFCCLWQGSWLIPIFKCEQAKLAHLTAAKRILSGQKDINGTGGRRWLELFNCAKFNQKENLEGCESLDSAAENIQADTRVCAFLSIILCLVSLYQFTRVNTWKRSSKSALFIISRPLDIAGADSNSSLSPSYCLCGMEWLNSAWTTSKLCDTE